MSMFCFSKCIKTFARGVTEFQERIGCCNSTKRTGKQVYGWKFAEDQNKKEWHTYLKSTTLSFGFPIISRGFRMDDILSISISLSHNTSNKFKTAAEGYSKVVYRR